MNEVKYYVVVLTAGDKAEIVEKEVPANAGSNLYRLAEKTLGCGYAELVRPVGFMGKYGFFISETSALDNLPANLYASALYGSDEYGHPIYGDAMVVRLTSHDMTPVLMRKKDTPEVKRLIRASEMRFKTNMEEIFKRYGEGRK